MIMRTAPEPSTDKGKRIHQELRDLLETVAVQQAQSSTKRRHPEASFIHISLARGAPEGHDAPSILQLDNDGTTHRQEPSPVRSHHVENHNACLARGARGQTGQAKTNYTMMTVTWITTTNILGFGTYDIAQAQMPAARRSLQ